MERFAGRQFSLFCSGSGKYKTKPEGDVLPPAVDTESLEVLWTFETGKNLITTSPYSTDDTGTVDSAVIPAGEMLLAAAVNIVSI